MNDPTWIFSAFRSALFAFPSGLAGRAGLFQAARGTAWSGCRAGIPGGRIQAGLFRDVLHNRLVPFGHEQGEHLGELGMNEGSRGPLVLATPATGWDRAK